MSEKFENFLDLCLDGRALLEDVDLAVEEWHKSNSPHSLPRFLGMRDDEYATWVNSPNTLKAIIFARKFNLPLVEALEPIDEVKIAARARSKEEAKQVVQWLRNTGLIS